MFFGLMKQSWGIFKKPYRLSHDLFDMDFDNCLYLTNELLKKRELDQKDREYYRKLRELRKNEFENKKRKQRESFQRYKLKKESNNFLFDLGSKKNKFF